MSDRHRFRVFDKQIGKYATNNLLLITSQSWLYVDGKCVSLEEPDRYIIEFCTGLSAAKSYRGEKPEDLLVWEGDKLAFTIFDCFDRDKQYSGVVVWSGSQFAIWKSKDYEFYGSDGGFDLYWTLAQDCELEIIGTIHSEVEK